MKIIQHITFFDIEVPVYYHPDHKDASFPVVWRARNFNPYIGIAYMDNTTGQISYPDKAVLPTQSGYDREIIPRCVVSGKLKLSDDETLEIKKYLIKSFLQRNKNSKHGS